jgi:hypothetical protein
MKRYLKLSILSAAAFAAANLAQAQELDNTSSRPANVPSALVVRTDAAGNREVFTADRAAPVANDADAAVAAGSIDNSRRVNPVAGSELDRSSSTQAWGYYPYGGYNYGYNYNYYYGYYNSGYNYCYYPTYNYYYGGYQYSYYWNTGYYSYPGYYRYY